MIPDELQDQASLYALELLDAVEAAEFERAMAGNVELQALFHSLQETVGDLALGVAPLATPPVTLKARVFKNIAADSRVTGTPSGAPAMVTVPFGMKDWVPWAIAASFMIGCGVFALQWGHLQRELISLQQADPLARAELFTLQPSDKGPAGAVATVAWDPYRQDGILRVSHLPAAAVDRDYQLWAIDGNKLPHVSAGIVHVAAEGAAQIKFKPDAPILDATAFAISVERAGGVAENQGPVILIGKK